MSSIQIDGMEAFRKLLLALPAKAEKGAHDALKVCALDLMGKSIDLAPVMWSDLQGSAYAVVGGSGLVGKGNADTHPETARGSIPEVYGNLNAIVGFTEPYALYQHENLGLRHPEDGQAKYLETPFKANRDKYLKTIGDAIGRELLK